MELRELIDRAAGDCIGSYVGPDRNLADAILAALDKAGIAFVPKTITREMGDELCYDYELPMLQKDWERCLAASPFAKGEKE